VENVTDRTHNPFGLSPPCEADCPGGHPAVFGYGDANADVHLVGDHPGVHGGADSGTPFTAPAVDPLRAVLSDVGLAGPDPEGEEPYVPENLYCSYRFPCCPGDDEPTEADYARLEPSFDAELRAIAAHVLVPVGDRALGYVLEEYTSRARRLPADAAALHASEVRGRGFLVVPVREPAAWTDGDGRKLRRELETLLSSDYRRTADLGRFLADDDSYLVR
jgi:uracil-DNA glycosylase family 4